MIPMIQIQSNGVVDKKGYPLKLRRILLVIMHSSRGMTFSDKLKVVAPGDVYRRAQFHEYHDQNGTLTFYDLETARDRIKHLEVYDIDSKKVHNYDDIPKGIL